jgi:tRNA(Ile2) C34 agmatinyltransferase TiaS
MITVVESLNKFKLNSFPPVHTVKTFECPKCGLIMQFKYTSPVMCPECRESVSFVDKLPKGLYNRIKYYSGNLSRDKLCGAWYD